MSLREKQATDTWPPGKKDKKHAKDGGGIASAASKLAAGKFSYVPPLLRDCFGHD